MSFSLDLLVSLDFWLQGPLAWCILWLLNGIGSRLVGIQSRQSKCLLWQICLQSFYYIIYSVYTHYILDKNANSNRFGHWTLQGVPNGWERVPLSNPLGFKHHPLEGAGVYIYTYIYIHNLFFHPCQVTEPESEISEAWPCCFRESLIRWDPSTGAIKLLPYTFFWGFTRFAKNSEKNTGFGLKE